VLQHTPLNNKPPLIYWESTLEAATKSQRYAIST